MFSHSIKFLKDEALKVICERTGDEYFNVKDIQWVLTVPAIWTPVAKQFMREAAYKVRPYRDSLSFCVVMLLDFISNSRFANLNLFFVDGYV